MVCLINKQDTKVLFLAKIFSLSVEKKINTESDLVCIQCNSSLLNDVTHFIFYHLQLK